MLLRAVVEKLMHAALTEQGRNGALSSALGFKTAAQASALSHRLNP